MVMLRNKEMQIYNTSKNHTSTLEVNSIDHRGAARVQKLNESTQNDENNATEKYTTNAGSCCGYNEDKCSKAGEKC